VIDGEDAAAVAVAVKQPPHPNANSAHREPPSPTYRPPLIADFLPEFGHVSELATSWRWWEIGPPLI